MIHFIYSSPSGAIKKIFTVFSISLILVSASLASQNGERDLHKLLNNLDVSHPVYGNRIYGKPTINKFDTADGSILLAYQARYGGDGDHSENILKLFRISESASKKLIDQNIDKVKFVAKNNRLTDINGVYIETLCNVCDGWEVSEQADIFEVPITINIEKLKVIARLTQAQKNELMKRLDARIDANISEKSSQKPSQAFTVDTKYIEYAKSVRKRIVNLLKN